MYLVYPAEVKEIRLNTSQDWATALIVMADPETGKALPSEPGLALVQKMDGAWQATLPGDLAWPDALEKVPTELLAEADRDFYSQVYRSAQADAPQLTFNGYYLPWKYNTNLSLSRSVAHVANNVYPSARNAYDFYHPVLDLFELYAAKPGTVWSWRDDIETCWADHCTGQGSGNYIVLKDTSTEPDSYQLYMHLAQNSIPAELKTVGAPVGQGQFLGMADNTGASYGHHVHFHVFTTPTSAYWGASIDITFNEVDINGGRPRATADLPYCTADDHCDSTRTVYTSKNPMDWMPPTGSLSAPAAGTLVTAATVNIAGSGSDSGTGLKNAQLTAFYENAWHDIGPLFTSSPFNYNFDLCSAGVQDGPVSLGLRLTDKAGNVNSLADLHHIQKDYACPGVQPPVLACIPNAIEASIYASAGWQGGCSNPPFRAGTYSGAGLSGVGDNNTGSLQVGSNVQVTLYRDPTSQGRAETFWADDANLEGNLIGADTVSALVVVNPRTPPAVPLLVWPASSQTISQAASLSLYWENAGGAMEYQARLERLGSGLVPQAGVTMITTTWQTDPFWHLGTGVGGFDLITGSYGWQVRARNGAGTSDWSAAFTFNIDAYVPPAPANIGLPFTDNFETNTNGWVGSGLWTRTNANPARSGSNTWWWGESNNGDKYYFSAKAGDLTSPPIIINAGQSAYLRFAYRYQTETSGRFWDQRWVQVSEDGGAFTNLYQLYDDPMNAGSSGVDWMLSPYINLSAYAGHAVRVRFHFDTMDPSGSSPDNDFEGWTIDDFSVTTSGPAACDLNDSEEGTVLSYNAPPTPGEICAPGDVDMFSFSANQGDVVVAEIDAYSEGSPLDAVLYVLDGDGASALAENDDQRSGFYDPLVRFVAPASGTYYLKVRAWDHGRSGGPAMDYKISLHTGDTTEPAVTLSVPPDNGWVAGIPLAVTAQILETGSGLDRVEFYWHSNDWLNGHWELLPGATQVGEDWMAVFDPAGKAEQTGVAFYVIAYDNGGLVGADVSWEVGLDRTLPQSTLAGPLAAMQDSPRIWLNWTASDNLSGLAGFDLQQALNGGGWVDYQNGISPGLRALEYMGTPGTLYGFRLRAFDKAGNVEAYPGLAELTTLVPAANVLCSAPDVYENDNTPANAQPLTIGNAPQVHNFCNPLEADFGNDQDWINVTVSAGVDYMLYARPLHEDTALKLTLYAADGTTIVYDPPAGAYNQGIAYLWRPVTSGTYYLRLAHSDGRVIGSAVQYKVEVFEPYTTYLPVIFR